MDASIPIGPFALQVRNGELIAAHPSLAQPLKVNEAQLARWLMRQVRESLTFDATEKKAAA